MSCHGCREAETNPHTHILYMGCDSCEARALAKTQEAKDAMIGHPQALQAAMRKLWKTREKYQDGRIMVYKWFRLMNPE